MGAHEGHDVRAGRAVGVDSLGDLPRPLAFVLSGGAALGAIQVGMLRALREAGVRPDLVVGASVGAVNGALVAADPEHAPDRLAAIWTSLRRADIFALGPLTPARLVLGGARSVFPASGLAKVMGRHLGATRFDQLRIPLYVTATDVLSGSGVLLGDGDLHQAILASTAIPLLLPPVARDGRLLVDGGLSANLPVRQAFEAGAASAVVLDVSAPCTQERAPRSPLEMLLVAAGVLTRAQGSGDAAVAAGRPVVHLPTPCTRGQLPLDFSRAREHMALAYDLAGDFLDGLRTRPVALPAARVVTTLVPAARVRAAVAAAA